MECSVSIHNLSLFGNAVFKKIIFCSQNGKHFVFGMPLLYVIIVKYAIGLRDINHAIFHSYFSFKEVNFVEHSQKVLNYMDSMGISAYKIHKSTGISESTFSKWRAKPTSKIDSSILEKISEYFNVSIDELLGNEQKNKPAAQSDGQDPKDAEIISKLDVLNTGNRDAVLALIDSLLKSQ